MDEYIKIYGQIKRILRRGEGSKSNSFAVVLATEADTGKQYELKLSAKLGHMEDGDCFEAEGMIDRTNEYRGKLDPILKAKKIKPKLPVQVDETKAFLSKHFQYSEFAIPAKKLAYIVDAMGSNAIKQFLVNPERLVGISNDPDGFREKILEKLNKITGEQQALQAFEESRLSETAIKSIFENFKHEAFEVLQTNPYTFLNVEGTEFGEIDTLALNNGVNHKDERRLSAITKKVISKSIQNGSAYHPLDDLRREIAKVEGITKNEIDEFLQYCKDNPFESGIWFAQSKYHGDLVASSIHAGNEIKTISPLRQFLVNGAKNPWEFVGPVFNKALQNTLLDEYQKEAIKVASTEPISIITGGPGTGKSTILEKIIQISKATEQKEVIILAPTGRAAKRAAETSKCKATTVSMLLGQKSDPHTGGNVYTYNHRNKLPDNILVIVDEISMMDTELFSALLSAMPKNGRLILQGDPDQLPSVGVGSVLDDLLSAEKAERKLFPIAKLVNTYRQNEGSKIVTDAKKINNRILPEFCPKGGLDNGVSFSQVAKHEICGKVKELVMLMKNVYDSKGKDVCKEVCIISPQRKGKGGTDEINEMMQSVMNSGGAKIPGMRDVTFGGSSSPRIGDRVMLTENHHDKGAMNGDIGTVKGYVRGEKGDYSNKVTVEFDDGNVVDFSLYDFQKFILAYAITCHKSQGSQYETVILPFNETHTNADKKLTYTAWTRAKKWVFAVGEVSALEKSLSRENSSNRVSLLRERIEAEAKKNDNIRPKGPRVITAQMPEENPDFVVREMPPANTVANEKPISNNADPENEQDDQLKFDMWKF